MSRAYTVVEIDDLRRAMRNRYLWGTYRFSSGKGMSRVYREDKMVRAVEEMVRTAMLAGHTAEDLCASEKDRAALSEKVAGGES